MSKSEGRITNIQRFSVHDGPGIRTTVFFKGCNMGCAWCHNPETISFEKETLFHPERCIGCGRCEDGCFAEAKVPCGVDVTVADVMAQVLADRDYYGEEGGVTISGGEPTCQRDFLVALLSALGEEGIHCAMETNVSLPWASIEPALRLCGLVMTDLKMWDAEKHAAYTGIGNGQIIQNLQSLSRLGIPFILRTPVMKNLNDSEEEILAMAKFAGSLDNLLYYELLPYHPLGLSKGIEGQQRFETPSREALYALASKGKAYCPNIWVSGVAL